MTLAWPAGTVFSFWRGLASALGSGDSAPAASACRSGTGDSVAWPSTPATAAPARGTPHCNNAPAAAGTGTSAYSPSTNISGAEGDEHEAWAPKLLGVDFPEKLKDLRVGPWEGDTPRSSSLEGEPIPLRDALFAQGESGNLATLPQTQIGSKQRRGEDWTQALSWAGSSLLNEVGSLFESPHTKKRRTNYANMRERLPLKSL
ncbi:MAG TPA: hypothetical protein VHM28_01755, partial [Anaerolineales bacterium]|nr:hypothetical protein [Anaerolineales bacterium]